MHGAIWCGNGCSTLALPFATPLPSAAAASSTAISCPCYTGVAVRRRPLGAVSRGPHRQTPRRHGGAVGTNDSQAGWNHSTSGHWPERASTVVVAAFSSFWRPTLRRATSAYTDPHGRSDVPGPLTHGSPFITNWTERPGPSVRSRRVLGAQLIGWMDVIVGNSGGRGGGASNRCGTRCAARRSSRSTALGANDSRSRVASGGGGGGDRDLEDISNSTGNRDKDDGVSVAKRRTSNRAKDAADNGADDSDDSTASTDIEDGASGPRIHLNRRKFVDAVSRTSAPAQGSAKSPTSDMSYNCTTEVAGMIGTTGGNAVESASSRGAARRGRTRAAANAVSATTAATALSVISASGSGRSREGAHEGTGSRPAKEETPSRSAGIVRRNTMAVGNADSDRRDTDTDTNNPRGSSSTHDSASDSVGVLIPMGEMGRGLEREGAGRGRRARLTRGSVGAVQSSADVNGSGTEVRGVGAGLSKEQEELGVVPSGTATAILMPANGSESFTAAVSTATPMAAMAAVAPTSQETPHSTTLRSTGRGRALTGLRTIIGRPGQRRGKGSSSNSSTRSSNKKTDDQQTDAAAAAAITAFPGLVAGDGLMGGTAANIAAA
ncbi:hypothetical protein Vafri_19186, partial [Volvox africanus]